MFLLWFLERWWIALMSSLQTQTAEWWWFPEQGRSSQLVGVGQFTLLFLMALFLQKSCDYCQSCVNCPGIDLMDMAADILQPQGDDTARISWNLRRKIAMYQETFSVIEKVRRAGEGFCHCFISRTATSD